MTFKHVDTGCVGLYVPSGPTFTYIRGVTFRQSPYIASSLWPNWYFQFSLVAQLCLILCDPMNRSMPGLLVHHQLPEFIQTHVH